MKSHAELMKRWAEILEETKKSIPIMTELYNDPIRNQTGCYVGSLHSYYRDLAVLDYLLNHNVKGFSENLKKAVPFKMELLEKYGKVEAIDPSRVSMTRFEELFDALASGDMELAQTYANHLGGRAEAEDTYDDECVLLLGYSLKYAVENNGEMLKSWLSRLKAFYENPKNRMLEFIGYSLVLEAILERDEEKANAPFKILLEGHKKKCKFPKGPNYGYGPYDSPDADLFVWGIGLANLCRHYGMNVQISDPLIPEELLIKNT